MKKVGTNNARIHVSFANAYTPTVKINLEKAFKLLRTNGRRGAFKGLNRRQSHFAAKLFIAQTSPKDVPESHMKDFLKMYLKTNIRRESFQVLDTSDL